MHIAPGAGNLAVWQLRLQLYNNWIVGAELTRAGAESLLGIRRDFAFVVPCALGQLSLNVTST